MSTDSRSSRLEALPAALAVAVGLLVASFGHWLIDGGGALPSGSMLQGLNPSTIWSTQIGLDLAQFALSQLVLHLAFGICAWLLACAARHAWPKYPASRTTWLALWLLLGTFWVLIANAAHYPRSRLGDHLYVFARSGWAGWTVLDTVSALVGALALATVGTAAYRQFGGRPSRGNASWLTAASLTLVATGTAFVTQPAAGLDVATRPHVILLGLDSMRCDLSQSDTQPGLAPNLNRFLAASTRFDDAMTPLARTFPSWMSILTGKHPHTTGAVVNLLHADQMKLGDTLPAAMRRAGYRTVFGIDEVRFANIDESYGFDQTITPRMGAGDFLLGMLNDAPLSNLVANTRLGQWLFPFTHANRAASTLYDPDTYVERLDRELEFDRPTFLALHLTLAHWPYVWADASNVDVSTPENWTAAHYWPAVQRVDRQFADVLAMLERKGALRNALVVVLSDHGEAIGQPGDSPWAMTGPEEDPYAWKYITGHGTSVLSPHQYRVLLALRGFGPAQGLLPAPGAVAAPTSLEDIAPTLDAWLNLRMRDTFDGRSLLPLLHADKTATADFADRIRFTETEFNPRGFLPGQRQTGSAMVEALRFYELDADSGRVYIRRSERPRLLRERQYAATRGTEMVAAIPGALSPGFRFIHLDTARSSLPQHLDGPPDPQSAPGAAALWTALHRRFGEALGAGSTVAQLADEPQAEDRAGRGQATVGLKVADGVTQRVTF